MAELTDLPELEDLGKEPECDTPILDEFFHDLASDYHHNLIEIKSETKILKANEGKLLEEMQNEIQERTTDLFQGNVKIEDTVKELQDRNIHLLQQKEKLLDRVKELEVRTASLLKLIVKLPDSVKELQERTRDLLQQKGKLQDSIKEISIDCNIFSENTEIVIEQTQIKFLNFREAYKTCSVIVESFFRNIENDLKIKARTQEKEKGKFNSILRERLASWISSKQDFKEIESILRRDLKFSGQGYGSKIKFLTTAINKASIVCFKIRSIIQYKGKSV